MPKTTPSPWPGFAPDKPEHQCLQAFLRLDIQGSKAAADEVRLGIEHYLNKEKKHFGGSANAFDFECRPEGLRLEPLYEQDAMGTVTVAYPDVLRALDSWMKSAADERR